MTRDHEDDDELVEYYLGGDPGEPDDEDTAEHDAAEHAASDRRTRRGALIGLAIVTVLVAVAITLTSLLVDTSSVAGDPRTAAQQWGQAFVHGDADAQRKLECAAGSPSADTLRLLTVDAVDASAGDAEEVAADRWSVPLTLKDLDGSTEDAVSITVVRESGRYVIC